MASNIKVDVVRPTATNGSLSLKGDSGGAATTNGVTVNSSGDTSITGTTTVSSLVATTADINGGTIDGADITGGTINNATIGGTTPAAVSATTLDVTVTSSSEAAVIKQSGTGDALRITQTGSGNALVVEDGENPDSTPFVVDANGSLIAGHTSRFSLNDAISIHSEFAATQIGLSVYNWNSSGVPRIQHYKSNSNTIGTYGALSNGTEISRLQFLGDDGSSFVEAARITAQVDNTPGTNDMPGRLVFSTTADNESSPTERMRIDSSGNVELKTTDAKLILPSGGGISFENHSRSTATGASSTASANVLDDYEEGTWTPAISGVTISSDISQYTKIGRMVVATSLMVLGSSLSGAFSITGLPFQSNSGCRGAVSINLLDASSSYAQKLATCLITSSVSAVEADTQGFSLVTNDRINITVIYSA